MPSERARFDAGLLDCFFFCFQRCCVANAVAWITCLSTSPVLCVTAVLVASDLAHRRHASAAQRSSETRLRLRSFLWEAQM